MTDLVLPRVGLGSGIDFRSALDEGFWGEVGFFIISILRPPSRGTSLTLQPSVGDSYQFDFSGLVRLTAIACSGHTSWQQ